MSTTNETPSAGDCTIDLSRLDAFATSHVEQPDFAARMVAMFIDEASQRIADTRAALAHRDMTKLRSAAHSLRGACGMVGARTMTALARELETAAAAQPDGELEPIVTALAAEFGQVRTLLIQRFPKV